MIEDEEVNILILSDRGVSREFAAVPALLAVQRAAPLPHPRGAAHARQPRARDRRGARGAPLRAPHRLRLLGHQPLPGLRDARRHDPRGAADRTSITKLACKNFVKAATKGVIKVMSKMGISAIQSYRGAQVFEAVGLRSGRHRPVLHLDGLAHRRHRHGDDRAGGADAPPRGLPARARPTATRSTTGGHVPVARPTASTTSSTPSRSTACRRPCAPAATPPSSRTPS